MFFDSVYIDILQRIIIAGFCGGILGLEREVSHKPAGLRTQVLVTIGCTLLVSIGEVVSGANNEISSFDPSRMAASVIQGLGFLGAGTIFQSSKSSIKGLTTAAMIWVNGAIGIAIGFHLIPVALFVTFLTLLIVVFLRKVETWINKRREALHYVIITHEKQLVLNALNIAMVEHNLPHHLKCKQVHSADNKHFWQIDFSITEKASWHHKFILNTTNLKGVESIWTGQ